MGPIIRQLAQSTQQCRLTAHRNALRSTLQTELTSPVSGTTLFKWRENGCSRERCASRLTCLLLHPDAKNSAYLKRIIVQRVSKQDLMLYRNAFCFVLATVRLTTKVYPSYSMPVRAEARLSLRLETGMNRQESVH
jgi:hypothetical protein